jgi:DNA polymerase-3 subunit delta'
MRTVEIDRFPEADRVEGCPHPRETYSLLGHEAAERLFIQAIEGARLHHAWLITGVKGGGKATLVYRMARYLLGASQLLNSSLDFSADDPVSQRLASLGHGNVFVLRRPYDQKTKKIRSEIPVSEARKLKEWRIVIIDSMDEMNRNAENAILKSLEEPPEKTMFFLICSNPGRLLPTIRSRCVSLRLTAVPLDQIQNWIKQRGAYDADIMEAAVKLSRGGPGRAFALCESADNVLLPLSRYIASLTKTADRVDMKISQSLARNDRRADRLLFWQCLADLLEAQARFTASGEWASAFKPFPIAKPATTWAGLASRMRQLAGQSDGLNMDHASVMMTALNEIRNA